MSTVHFGETACEKTRRYLDSYVSNELLVETNHEVLRHLERCRDCAADLEVRLRLKQQVKAAVERDQAPPDLQVRIRERIRRPRRQALFAAMWPQFAAAAAACALLVIAFLQFYPHRNLPALADRAAQRVYIQRVSQAVAAVFRVGLGDHIHCSVFRKYAKNPPTL